MAVRKYAKFNEKQKVVGCECTNKKCKWQGIDSEKAILIDDIWEHLVCPKCHNKEFYGILYFNKTKIIGMPK